MLIYNFQKEFLGIDEKDLRVLGFNSLEELRNEVTDFADLFVKTPGYIHNFKHVHWIDFIHYSDESEEAKVLIKVKNKTFKANPKVSTLFLIDNPSAPAFMIQLQNLHPLSQSENDNISHEAATQELPKVEPQQPKVFTAPTTPSATPVSKPEPIISDAYDTPTPAVTPSVEVPVETKEAAPVFDDIPLEIDMDAPLDIHEPADISLDVFDEPKESVEKTVEIEEVWDNGYRYDPHIASKELGLPIDLIEEFIQDFILQAKDFHSDIYSSIEKGDVDNVKMLSHKLKGVAANLRIEDAHEVLSAVSATDDMDIIHENLDTFYKIIAKLAGEPIKKIVPVENKVEDKVIPQEEEFIDSIELDFKDDDQISVSFSDEEQDEEVTKESTEIDDDIIQLDFKDNDTPLEIHDEDVPQKIEIPELADDNFFDDITEDKTEDSKESITIEAEDTFAYSKQAAAQEIGIDYESFNELFEDFVQESHTIFQNITTAIKNEDFDTCRNEALKFKGMSDNMRLHEFTSELEVLIHSQDKDAIIRSAEKIDATITKISQMGA